ncbi:STAS domain-containing protein, partial [Nonomuraea basaltis]|uniref:STAS domain-containing protein n=1 Tax=Nonomuraea basaltis TaxID=2495887 RepID=UPI00110C42DB
PHPSRASSAALTFTHQHLPGMSVIAIGGDVDRTSSARLAAYLDQVRRPGDHVVLDLSELSFLDSSGLHVVLACARRCAAEDAGVHLAAAHGAPARLFQITGVDAHLPVHGTVEDAITAVLTGRRTS